MSSPDTTSNNFHLLRLLLAIAVIFEHSFGLLLGVPDPITVALGLQHDRSIPFPIGPGTLAVNCFFVISGWLITMSWQRSRNAVNYLWKRVLRIYPGFLTAVFIGVVVVAPLGSNDVSKVWKEIGERGLIYVKGALLLSPAYPQTLPDVKHANGINGSLWTIPYEFRCYLMVMLVGLLWLRCRSLIPEPIRKCLPGLLFLCSYGLYIAFASHRWNGIPTIWEKLNYRDQVLGDFAPWPRLLTYFLAGVCLYAYRDSIQFTRRNTMVCIGVVVVTALWIPLLTYAFPIFGSYAIMAIGFDSKLPLPKIPPSIDLSYGTCLYAWPIQQLLAKYFGTSLNGYTHFLWSTIATLLVASASWFWIERPMLRLKPRSSRLPAT